MPFYFNTKPKFTEILQVNQILEKIGRDAVSGLDVPQLRGRRDWARAYIAWLDAKGERLALELDDLDYTIHKKLYKSIDDKLYLIADTMPVAKNCLIDIEHTILYKSSKSIFSVGKNANSKALNHGGVYRDIDRTIYGTYGCGKRTNIRRGIIKGVSL